MICITSVFESGMILHGGRKWAGLDVTSVTTVMVEELEFLTTIGINLKRSLLAFAGLDLTVRAIGDWRMEVRVHQ